MRLLRRAFGLLLLGCVAPPGFAATLQPSDDCPIAKPFAPVAAIRDDGEIRRVDYALDDYKIERWQLSVAAPDEQPVTVHIVWHSDDKIWGDKSGDVQVQNGTRCFSGGIFPTHTPAQSLSISAAKAVKISAVFSDKTWDAMGACPAGKLCPQLAHAIDDCRAAPDKKSCTAFFDLFKELAAPYHCRRAFDTVPVPAIWLCKRHDTDTSDIIAEALPLARSLKFTEGRAFYRSDIFASVLDGAYGEEYHDDQTR